MNQNSLFKRTKLRLTCYYAGVMGVILSICGLGVYEAIAHAHWITLDREIESVAGALHDSLETVLKQPGQLEPDVLRIIPDLCFIDSKKSDNIQFIFTYYPHNKSNKNDILTYPNSEVNCLPILDEKGKEFHRLAPYHNHYYLIHLFNNSGDLVAFTGTHHLDVSPHVRGEVWQTFTDQKGIRYRQYSLILHTRNQQNWGILQLGRSLQDFDQYMNVVTLILVIGLPLALILVGFASLKLAGIAMQPIYSSYQQIQQFTADAAHELRTPLAAICATVESTIKLEPLTETEAKETLKTVERQNHRLSKLVQDLLLLSRMDQENISLSKKLCCLNDLISDAQEELAAMVLNADLSLKIDIPEKEPIYSVGNEEQLYRVIFNLAINAIQYTPPKGQIIFCLYSSHQQAIIQVKDTGIGIPLTEQSRIFDRFYRVHSDRSRKTGGSGLGLAIVKAIVKAHRGSIEVESQPGIGSTFTIRLPLKPTATLVCYSKGKASG
ncbi:Alkaline phosphatase synthesis sensor protein PhoR [Planktothrix tepida]|uniref:histidine kinase n=1 Tax=Planktothrix tepida PCC 9214 TaxID=671072 RepID=A0A1J1LED7_9CYAN|nr:two-component system sensor histidine kinase RppB [Planktothrix tepida]CAD5953642.1 Alkaline phosphatase synthesis sensor protein PhoR [Planktothrix tepida]CUR30354.1 Two-component sensor histidine kinase [Planktothrix tepida PCC 9214]